MPINQELIDNFMIPIASLRNKVDYTLLPNFSGLRRPFRPIIPLSSVRNQEELAYVIKFLMDACNIEGDRFNLVNWSMWRYVGVGRTGQIVLYDLISSFCSEDPAVPLCYVVDDNTVKLICSGVPYESIIDPDLTGTEVRPEVP